MRVGHLVSSYLHVTENWIHAQMTACDRLTPVVLNRGARTHEALFAVADACHLADLDAKACRREANGWAERGFSPAFAAACRRARVKVLHAHFGPEGVLGAPLAAALRVPLVTSFYGYDATVLPRDAAWQGSYRRLFEVGTLFLAEGPAMAETLVRLGCPPERVRLSPLPVRIPAQAARPGSPLILVCGRLVEKKGTDTSLRVLARVRSLTTRRFRAVIVGDGPERARLERLHQRLALADCAQFAGGVSPGELDRLLGSATALLQMSRTAADGDAEGGAPVVVSQALAAGVPVVATRHCDIPWIVRDEETGFVVGSRAVDDAAHRLVQILETPALRQRLARAGRASARQRLSMQAAGEALVRHYTEAVRLGPVAPAGDRRPDPLRVGVAMEFRRRAGDAEGLEQLADARSQPVDVRGTAARLAGQVHREQGRPHLAARRFAQWRRLAPADSYAGMEEARAWLSTTHPTRAVAPLAAFVTTHSDRAFALSEATALLESGRPGAQLAPRLLSRVGTPADRLAYDVRSMETGDRPLFVRARLRRALARYRRATARRQSPQEQADAALMAAYLLALQLDDGQTVAELQQLRDGVRDALLKYRMASALEARGGEATAWARRTFRRLERSRQLSDEARAGARIHLARIERPKGTTS